MRRARTSTALHRRRSSTGRVPFRGAKTPTPRLHPRTRACTPPAGRWRLPAATRGHAPSCLRPLAQAWRAWARLAWRRPRRILQCSCSRGAARQPHRRCVACTSASRSASCSLAMLRRLKCSCSRAARSVWAPPRTPPPTRHRAARGALHACFASSSPRWARRASTCRAARAAWVDPLQQHLALGQRTRWSMLVPSALPHVCAHT